jgi:RNA polymerase sigma-70 factor (ECF subfamily)
MRSGIGSPDRRARRTAAVLDTRDARVRFRRGLLAPATSCEDRIVSQEIPTGSGAPDADAARVVEMAAGSSDALAALYDRHAASMLGLAHRVLGNRRDAEDLVHDVFLEAWHRAGSYDPTRGSVRSWLLVRVRSRALDRLRALEVAQRHADGDAARAGAEPPAHPEAALLGGVARTRALEAIDALPEAQREVVRLSCLEGMSSREIAERCGLPVGTVKSRLARALALLRERLGVDGETA